MCMGDTSQKQGTGNQNVKISKPELKIVIQV